MVPTLKAEPASHSGGRGVRANLGRGGRGTGRSSAGKEERPKSIAYNNAYMEGRWGLFRQAGVMRIITRKSSIAVVELPVLPVEPKCKAYPAFHIKDTCNTGCRNMTDHVAYTPDQDLPLWGWAVRAMPEIAASLAPDT